MAARLCASRTSVRSAGQEIDVHAALAEDKPFYAAADTGFIGENVYLFCASAGLATVIRGYLDREAMGQAMQLGPDQHVVLAQTVGYPAD